MNPENCWVKMAALIPWDKFEMKYVALFLSDTGNVVKPLRMALGSMIIQQKLQYHDRELVLFRKRISDEMLMEVNEYLLAHKDDDDNSMPLSAGNDGSNDAPKENANKVILILDATCALVNIHYPQDISMLNEAGEKLEAVIYCFGKSYGLPLPKRYSRRARKDYLAFAISKKHSAEKSKKYDGYASRYDTLESRMDSLEKEWKRKGI